MKVAPVPVVNAPLSEAFQRAKAESMPVFVPTSIYTDDRGWSLMNQFTGILSPQGQVNFSVQYPGVIKAWHRHSRQTDFWMCVQGHLKVGIHRDDGAAWQVVTGEKRPGVVIIPPPLWHGAATVGPTSAGLLYFLTHAYDAADPDEERKVFDALDGFPWAVEHR